MDSELAEETELRRTGSRNICTFQSQKGRPSPSQQSNSPGPPSPPLPSPPLPPYTHKVKELTQTRFPHSNPIAELKGYQRPRAKQVLNLQRLAKRLWQFCSITFPSFLCPIPVSGPAGTILIFFPTCKSELMELAGNLWNMPLEYPPRPGTRHVSLQKQEMWNLTSAES